jgi:alpha-L-rhamnosidase
MTAALVPYRLRTEYADEPLGVDEAAPRFSWLLRAATTDRPTPSGEPGAGEVGEAAARQSAYQVVVASDVETLRAGQGEVWDSGRVDSDQTNQVEYGGAPLRSATRYVWAVRVWDGVGQVSDWSEPASFETGLLNPDDWGGARWIGHPAGRDGDVDSPVPPSPLLRTTFPLPPGEVARARLYVSGLGYGEYFLDGHRIGRAVLDPAPTAYHATVLYSTYDVTDLLRVDPATATTHALAAALGRGRYGEPTPNVWYWEKAPWWDHPALLAQLVVWYADGRVQRIVSDETWRCVDGPTRADSLYAGEEYDARYERPGWTQSDFDDSAWSRAVAVRPPGGVPRSQQVEQIEPVAEIAPVRLTEPTPGVFVFDLGQQVAGWARVRLSGPAGTRVRIRYGERLRPDGTVDIEQQLIYRDIQTDHYVLRGDGVEVYQPRFSYKGFQYVQIDGHPSRPTLDDLRGVAVHTAVASTGEFDCDDEVINRLHAGTRRAVLNNLHGIPTDTPVFEKNGWTGDAHLTATVAAYNFHMPRLYTKWLRDWQDAQLPNGAFPPIVPTSGWGYPGDPDAAIVGPIPAWDVAYVEIPWVMYQHYGDERVLARHYDGARRYLDYLIEGFCEDDVVLVGLGDYLPPGVGGVPPEGPGVYETAYTFRFVQLLRQFATVLDKRADLAGYDELMTRLRNGFNRAFFDPATATYHGERPTGYRQSANVVALAFGLAPEEVRQAVLDNLVADIHARQDHLDTGVIGTKFLFPLLTRHGLVDLAYTVATQRTYPGYGFWLEQGATALYEHWQADSRSRDHHFFGHIDQWFIEDLAGVTPAAPGFARVRVRPVPPRALGRASVALDTVRGRVASAWRRVDDGFEVTVELPPGVTAEVHVPRPDGEYVVEHCGPGAHTFRS